MTVAPSVWHNAASSQFEIQSAEDVSVLVYRIRGNVMETMHTAVPAALEGQGYGSALARAALDHARQNNLLVIATCPFVRKYMERHREYDDLRAPA